MENNVGDFGWGALFGYSLKHPAQLFLWAIIIQFVLIPLVWLFRKIIWDREI